MTVVGVDFATMMGVIELCENLTMDNDTVTNRVDTQVPIKNV